MLPRKSFIQNNENFVCEVCNHKVKPHPSSSRDHCTNCLWGKHVDVNPGDRANSCKGLLKPLSAQHEKGKMKLVYKCTTCETIVRNVAAPDDNMIKIIELSTNPF